MIGSYIFIAIGSIIFLWGLRLFIKGKQTNSWKPNTGKINKVNLAYQNIDTEDGYSMRYECKVEYEYRSLQNNLIKTGNKIAVGYLPSGNEKGHLAILEKINSAKVVRIWENPKNENETCISKGINGNSYFILTFGAMFILFALSLMTLTENKPPKSNTIYKVEIVD